MYVNSLRFFFSMHQLSTQRVKFQHKICFKESNSHLKLKTTPAVSIASRLFRDGNFLRLYKQCQKSFVFDLTEQVKSLPHNNEFKNLYNQYESFRDFNRVLFWKIMSVNCLFNLKTLKKKRILYYLRVERRQVLILSWLKNLIKMRKKNYDNCSIDLYKPLLTFITTNRSTNDVFSLKLKIYKLRMLRG